MRKVSMFIAGCFVFAMAISMFGQARSLDTIMKEIGPLWQGAPGGAPALAGPRGGAPILDSATPDLAKVAADAAKLQSLFTEAAGEFTKLKLAEPADFATKAAAAAGDLAKEAKAGKITDAKASKAAIGTCGGCHMKYREPDPAGGFKLKAQ
jgi:hypothetical protein